MVSVDYSTKWEEAEFTEKKKKKKKKKITSKDVIMLLINVFARHGAPQVITTDNVSVTSKHSNF